MEIITGTPFLGGKNLRGMSKYPSHHLALTITRNKMFHLKKRIFVVRKKNLEKNGLMCFVGQYHKVKTKQTSKQTTRESTFYPTF